jgi:hypothetical protein
MAITQTYIPLQTVKLSGSASSITFSNIPQTYKDLILVAKGISTGGAYDQAINFNNSSTGYTCVIMWSQGTSNGVASSSFIIDYYGSVSSTQDAITTVHIADYSVTNKNKTYLSRSNRAGNGLDLITGRWNSTAAITTLKYFLNGGTLAAGTTVSLYGVHG